MSVDHHRAEELKFGRAPARGLEGGWMGEGGAALGTRPPIGCSGQFGTTALAIRLAPVPDRRDVNKAMPIIN